MSLRSDFLAFDDRLGALGVPLLTAWWRRGLGEWLDAYEGGGPLELWACVGRGASKSTALYKLALFWTLFVNVDVPEAERHYAMHLSGVKQEASKGLAIVDRWLTLLDVPHRLAGDCIEVGDSRGLRVVAASVGAASGWRCYFVSCDEFSKWATGGVEEFNAGEVRSSAIAMGASHPRVPVVTAGSTWGAFGEFYEAITTGTTADRWVLGPAASWIAAAEYITEESTRRKEPNPVRHASDYGANFRASLTALWNEQQVGRIMGPREKLANGQWRQMYPVSRQVLVTDPSNLKKDAWTAALGGWWQYQDDEADQWVRTAYPEPRAPGGKGLRTERDPWGNPILNPHYRRPEPFFLLHEILTYDKTFGRSGASLVAELAAFARKQGVFDVVSDQRDQMLLASEFARHRLRFQSFNYTNTSKADAVLWLAERVRTDSLRIAPHARMREEMLQFREKILPSGTVVYQGLKHDDHVSLLLTSAIADVEGAFRGSPTNVPGGGPPQMMGAGDFRNSYRK